MRASGNRRKSSDRRKHSQLLLPITYGISRLDEDTDLQEVLGFGCETEGGGFTLAVCHLIPVSALWNSAASESEE